MQQKGGIFEDLYWSTMIQFYPYLSLSHIAISFVSI